MVNPVIAPKSDNAGVGALPLGSRPARQGSSLHGHQDHVQDLEDKTHNHEAHSSWAALLQHECDHLDGILYPMRMTDLSLLAYNDEPGPLALEVKATKNIDPLFVDLVERWPGRSRWFG